MELNTRKEAAELFDVKPRTLWHWEKKGILIPTLHINGRPRYSMQALANLALSKGIKSKSLIQPKTNS